MIYKRDLEFGFKMEDDLFEKIKDKYGKNICKTGKNCRVDYESDDVLIELKSRRNNYSKYPTTMISKGKIDYMLKSNKKSICLFNFTDGLYTIEITENIVEKFELREGGRWDRGRPEMNQYYYIPINLLTKLV